jgi:TPR repeat protein
MGNGRTFAAALAGSLVAAGLLVSPLAAAQAGIAAARADDVGGELNPDQLGVDYYIGKAGAGKIDPHLCAYGVFMDKTGRHDEARKIFERCARDGNENAMPWMSFMEENGFDRPSDPAAAADWDKKLADRGSSLGAFNFGLDLLRGHGIARDEKLGRAMIDRAAQGGDKTAKELIAHGYDPESVTPGADRARYRQPQF